MIFSLTGIRIFDEAALWIVMELMDRVEVLSINTETTIFISVKKTTYIAWLSFHSGTTLSHFRYTLSVVIARIPSVLGYRIHHPSGTLPHPNELYPKELPNHTRRD